MFNCRNERQRYTTWEAKSMTSLLCEPESMTTSLFSLVSHVYKLRDRDGYGGSIGHLSGGSRDAIRTRLGDQKARRATRRTSRITAPTQLRGLRPLGPHESHHGTTAAAQNPGPPRRRRPGRSSTEDLTGDRSVRSSPVRARPSIVRPDRAWIGSGPA